MSNRLPILCNQIRQAKAEADRLATRSAEKIMEAGQALIEAKALCEHGNWLAFLSEAGLHRRTAQRYMKLAASDLKSDFVSHLGGPSAALRFLALRETAMQHFDSAEMARIACERGEDADEMTPLVSAIHTIEEMLRLFPDYEGAAL